MSPVCLDEDSGLGVYGDKEMIINNRFKMKTTPQEEAFGRLSEEGMLSAMFEVQGIIADVDQDWPFATRIWRRGRGNYQKILPGVCFE